MQNFSIAPKKAIEFVKSLHRTIVMSIKKGPALLDRIGMLMQIKSETRKFFQSFHLMLKISGHDIL
jgi:hypothetical protein